MHLRTLSIALLACSHALAADSLTIQPKEFLIRHSIAGEILPTGAVPLAIDARHWTAFEIESLLPHGAAVKKDESMVTFVSQAYEERVTDFTQAIAKREIDMTRMTAELAELKATATQRVEDLRRAAAQAADDHAYYVETRHAVDVESAAEAVKRAEHRLQSVAEELRQLERMYAADDLVEETEEIILTRQRQAVEAAEFSLRVEKLDQKRRVEVALQRQIQTLEVSKRDTARKLALDEADIPRAIAAKESELATLQTTQARDQKMLADLTIEKASFILAAPADGTFYHGVIEQGAWTLEDAAKVLILGGRPPVKRAFATFIPQDATMAIHAALTPAVARSIGDAKPKGLATLAGREDVAIPVALKSLSTVPSPAKRHHAVFEATWPNGSAPAAGATATIELVAYHKPEAISVPKSALTYGVDGWAVEVKLADGKTQQRAVTRGRVNGDEVEILNGIEAGQVIVLP